MLSGAWMFMINTSVLLLSLVTEELKATYCCYYVVTFICSLQFTAYSVKSIIER